MNPSKSDGDDMNLKSLEHFIKEEQKRLEEDKFRLQRNIENTKKRRSDGNYNQPFHDILVPDDKNDLSPNNADVNDRLRKKFILKDKSKTLMTKSSREEEISKLIEKISKPREQQIFPSNKNLRRSYPQARSDFRPYFSPVNLREREKDQLSEKLASSECPLTKPSCRQIAKNLCSSISFNDYKENNLEKASGRGTNKRHVEDKYISGGDENINKEYREEYLRAKYNHPKIVISHYKESNKDIGDSIDNKMVRIGEFSPLNPNLPGGATVLGLGDWEEKRQLLLQQYREVSRSPSPSPSMGDHSHNLRTIATQTDLSDDWSPSIVEKISPHRLCETPEKSPRTLHGRGCEDEESHYIPQTRASPIPKCFENMTEKEVKEVLYRRELDKQIEEKNRRKENMKKKEAEEEAKIEAKIQRDLERMRKQYEEERLQRLQLAIRRKEQEDLFRQRLVVEQQKAMQESKIIKKRPERDYALPNYTDKQFEKSTQSDFKNSSDASVGSVLYSRSLPERSAASALSNVHEQLRQPLLQPSNNVPSAEELESYLSGDRSSRNSSPHLRKTNKSLTNTSIPPSVSVRGSKEMDVLAQKAVFETNLNTTPRMNTITHFPSDTVRDRLKEVDNILKQPLLLESRVLPPVSQPLLHATVPPLSASLQTSRAVSNRTRDANILEDKWKVPYVDQDTEADTNNKHNTRILTQLGTFRRQLQEESLRMRQRVREDSP